MGVTGKAVTLGRDLSPPGRHRRWPVADPYVCYTGRMTIAYLPTVADRALIERAGCHAAPDHLLHPDARWGRGTDDLRVARVMLALERGARFTQAPNGRWYATPGDPLNGAGVSGTIIEMIRTGLVVHHRSGALVPAKVHLNAGGRSACGEPGEGMGPKRIRLHADPLLVDCLACLDRL